MELITAWRSTHAKALLTEFEATVPRTRSWLADIVGPSDSKILFMVDVPNVARSAIWGSPLSTGIAAMERSTLSSVGCHPARAHAGGADDASFLGPGSLVAKATRGPG